MRHLFLFVTSLLLAACGSKVQKIRPLVGSVSESVYASGTLKSENQYQAFVSVNGVVEKIYVTEGDSIKKGDVILTIRNDAQRLNRENALLASEFADLDANQGKLKASRLSLELLKAKMQNDSLLFVRQARLWQQNIGTKVDYEQRDLAYQNSRQNYSAALINYFELDRQLRFTASQSRKNLFISEKLENDFTLRSGVNGIVYSLLKKEGEIVSPQAPLAVLGSADKFILELQVDEYDILRVEKGQTALITMDSYKDQVFEAHITRIYPLMNPQNKTFLVEARFKNPPANLYPNISFEANIILQKKERTMTLPRNYILNDSLVITTKGDTLRVQTGLKDYHTVEIISGLKPDQELVKPEL